MDRTGQMTSVKNGTPALPGAKFSAASIMHMTNGVAQKKDGRHAHRCRLEWETAPEGHDSRRADGMVRQPTSNWKGPTCQPMFSAATVGKNRWDTAAHRLVTPTVRSRIHNTG